MSKTKETTTNLGTEKIPRLVLSFTATTMTASLFHSLYNLLDALFVSWGIGDNAMGGVSVVFPFVIFQAAIAAAVGGGAASLISRRLGESKPSQAGETTLNAMFVFYASAISVTVLGFLFMNPLLSAMGVTGDLLVYSKQYFIIILAGNIFSTGFSSIIRAEGRMRYAFMIWIIPISINIVLDSIFIFVLKMGVVGSALGTVIGQAVSFGMSIFFFARLSTQKFKGAKLKPALMLEILKTGTPSLVQMGGISITTLVINNTLSNTSGTLGVNTFAYVGKILSYMTMPFSAITQSLAPIVGYNYGIKNAQRVKETVKFSSLISFAYAGTAFIILQLSAKFIIAFFTKNAAIISLGTSALRVITFSLFFAPLPMILAAFFQATGKRLWAVFLNSINVIVLIPAVLIAAKFVGTTGIWWAYILSGVVASAIALAKIISLTRKPQLGMPL